MKIQKMKVIKVTKTEFELENGQVFEHPVELDEIPSIDDFQEIYNEWAEKFIEMFGGDDGKTDNNQ